MNKEYWEKERESAIYFLRGICKVIGSNNWTEELHLGDIIDKHLGDYILERGGILDELLDFQELKDKYKKLADYEEGLEMEYGWLRYHAKNMLKQYESSMNYYDCDYSGNRAYLKLKEALEDEKT